MNMICWMFDCLFLHRLDCAIDLHMKVKFWTHVAICPLEANGKCNSLQATFVLEGSVEVTF